MRGAWRAWLSFGLVLAWWMLERTTGGGPSCKRHGCAEEYNLSGSIKKYNLAGRRDCHLILRYKAKRRRGNAKTI